MAKNKNSNSLDIERSLAKLMQKIESQEFENVDQLNEFMKSMQGKSLDDLPESTTIKGCSQDLVFVPYE